MLSFELSFEVVFVFSFVVSFVVNSWHVTLPESSSSKLQSKLFCLTRPAILIDALLSKGINGWVLVEGFSLILLRTNRIKSEPNKFKQKKN